MSKMLMSIFAFLVAMISNTAYARGMTKEVSLFNQNPGLSIAVVVVVILYVLKSISGNCSNCSSCSESSGYEKQRCDETPRTTREMIFELCKKHWILGGIIALICGVVYWKWFSHNQEENSDTVNPTMEIKKDN